MSEEYNPYAPPAPIPEDRERPARRAPGRGVWQEDGKVVIRKDGSELPDRCVVCNRATDYKLKKTFMWHHPAYYLLFLGGWFIYYLLQVSVRKIAVVEIGLCDIHYRRRRTGLYIGWIGFVASFLLMMLAGSSRFRAGMFVSLVAMIVLPIVGALMARVASAAKIDDWHVWLRAGEPFVASLPASREEAEAPPPKPKKAKPKKAKKAPPEA